MIDSFCQNFSPPSDQHPAEWAARNVHLMDSPRSSKFAPDQVRYWIKPMGCFADYVTTNIVCIMPTGAGKSTFFEAITNWIIVEKPGGLLYASQTDGDAEFWGETRLLPSLKKNKTVDPLWPSNLRASIRKDAMVFPHMFIVLGGANISNFQEKSITYGLGDEAWKWKRGLVAQWLARSHNRENRKFVLASQAGVVVKDDEKGKSDELHLEHEKCRQWEFGWKCDCGSVQPFAYEQLKFEEVRRADGTLDDQLSADTTRRICPTCGKVYPDNAVTRRALHDSLKENDGYILTRDTGQRGYEGFHVDRGGMWWCSWANDVLKKIHADRLYAAGDSSGLEEWTQKDRAVGWSESDAAKPCDRTPSGYTREDYTDARKIDGEADRFATIDAGGDHFWMGVRGWCAGGDSKLLYFSYLGTEEECEAKRIEYGVEARRTFLDVGFDQERMATIIVRYGWIGLKGDGSRKRGWDWEIKSGPKKGQMENRFYSKRWYAPAKGGGRAECWHIATTPLQYFLQRLIDGKGVKWEYPDNAQPSYVKHLSGERLVEGKWTRFGANHGRDCEVYSLVAALMHKVFLPAPEDLPDEEDSDEG